MAAPRSLDSVQSFLQERHALLIGGRFVPPADERFAVENPAREDVIAHVAAALRAGTFRVNRHDVFDAAAPFGGFKQSGYGREMGRHALELYTRTKNVIVNLG